MYNINLNINILEKKLKKLILKNGRNQWQKDMSTNSTHNIIH